MAKSKKKPKENISGFFRGVFQEHPHLLGEKSNRQLLTIWLAAHPGDTTVDQRVKQTLANLKSQLRREQRDNPEAAPSRLGQPFVPHTPPAPVQRSHESVSLATLEEAIDDCLSAAKSLDPTGLKPVIESLRQARNKVVWKIGK